MRTMVALVCIGLLRLSAHAADREVRGRVIDADGKPVGGASVGTNWSGNGTGKKADGSPLDLTKPGDLAEFWGHLGQMEARGITAVTTGPDGSFTVKLHRFLPNLMAMDPARKTGGRVVIPKDFAGEPIEIRLGPLVRVRAKLAGPGDGQRAYWTNVYVETPADPTRPLDVDRLVFCGSFESRLDVLLPPGEYVLDAYGQTVKEEDDIDVKVAPHPKIVVPSDAADLDLGTLRLARVPDASLGMGKRLETARAGGPGGDYTKHFGEPPPKIHATDARGVAKRAQVSDYRGKWVLLAFWGPSCRPCIATEMPKLMQFYDDHAADRDRFEILSVCITFEDEAQTIADLERDLKPMVEHIWKGKSPAFPVLLDPSLITWERFGLPGLGTVILIDPDGKMVAGDEATLAERLKAKR